MRKIIPVILSGGSGTRLWPLSREERPKQLLPLVTDHTLLQETLLRTQRLGAHVERPIVVCNESHRFLVAEQLREIGVAPQTIVLEPAGRNTAPAVAVAALLAVAVEPDALLLVLPADHVILDVAAFASALAAALEAATSGRLATFGIVPSRPETGYGYLRVGKSHGAWAALDRFVEKPDAAAAQRYVDSGEYLWNSGMFVFRARTYLDELESLAPAMVKACRAAVAASDAGSDFTRLGPAFVECPADSIDYAVMEKTHNAAVVPLAAEWSDVGSWAALHEVLAKDEHGNAFRGDVVAKDCTNTCVLASQRLVAAVGLEGIVVVETADAVLVTTANQSQRVKEIVDALKGARRVETREASAGSGASRPGRDT
jgi:mannose-1-phosphate guanylyltransferase/mannose-6-phosphate isomerase